MSIRNRVLEANNRFVDRPWEEAGTAPSLSSNPTLEDRFIQVLEDCITANPPGLLPVRLDWFREFVRDEREALNWPHKAVSTLLVNDDFACLSLLYWVARLRRMVNRHQWACNCLLEMGFTPEKLPAGDEYL